MVDARCEPSLPAVPPFAGICSLADAVRPGLSVDECVSWLKRLHYVWRRLHENFTARITSEPLFELKTAFSHHGWLCAEHAGAIRTRVSELREPPLGLEAVPHAGLERVLDELRSAPDGNTFCQGVYGMVLPALRDSINAYLEATNLLADAPSVRILRFARLELDDLLAFGEQARLALPPADLPGCDAWQRSLLAALAAAGGLSGRETPVGTVPAPHFSRESWKYDRIPRRDARFHDPYNAGVNPEAFLYDTRFSPRDKTLMLFYKRLREIDVPEMMASLLVESPGKPWGFHQAMARQLWDEARHSLMGEAGFAALQVDWRQIPVNFTWSLNLNTQLTPQERHAVLFFIEQGLMPRTGKRYEWEVAQASGVPVAALFQDFDWADEVLHSQLGREWYVKDFGDLNAALDYGDRCWSKVMSHWREYRDEGLTAHRNWWPDVYSQACASWGTECDPQALAFSETYETVRADLKEITGSA